MIKCDTYEIYLWLLYNFVWYDIQDCQKKLSAVSKILFKIFNDFHTPVIWYWWYHKGDSLSKNCVLSLNLGTILLFYLELQKIGPAFPSMSHIDTYVLFQVHANYPHITNMIFTCIKIPPFISVHVAGGASKPLFYN